MPGTGDKFEVNFSRGKSILLLLGSLLFVALGLGLILQPQFYSKYGLFVQAVGLASVIFFGLCGLAALGSLISRKAALVFDDQGLTMACALPWLADSWIEWTEVVHISQAAISSNQFIVLHLKDNQAYIDRLPNHIFKKLGRWNMRLVGSPVAISAVSYKISHQKLWEVVNQYFATN